MNRFLSKFFDTVGLTIVLLASTVLPTFAANATVVVEPGDMATSFLDVAARPLSWFFYNDELDAIDSTLGSFVVGPATAPAGSDSIQIAVSGTQRRNLATYQFSGTPLANITTLAYSTYNPSVGNGGSSNRSGYLNFNVDFNGTDTWQRRLVFVPSQNGIVVQNSWQEWDAINGGNAMWAYSGVTWPATAVGPDASLVEAGTTLRSWSDILADYPGIRIRVTDSWLGIRVGEPYADGYTENIDSFKFGTSAGATTFDFDIVEEVAPPTNKDQCKQDKWMSFNNPTFSSKKECEKYVKDHKDDGKAQGSILMSSPSQKMKFEVSEKDDEGRHNDHQSKYGKIEYWNFDYPGVLHYKAKAMCVEVDKITKEARFMFQIPNGWPGVSGLYVVSYVKEVGGHATPDLYGHAATADLATATTWCETGTGFSPSMYSVTRGRVGVE